MALGEVAQAVLIAKGRLSYGGHLRDDGFTAFLVHECERYGSRDRPFTGQIPWPVHRQLTFDQITALRRSLGLYGTYVFLDRTGQPIADPIADRDSAAHDVSETEAADSFTAARHYFTATCDARLIIGGQRAGFQDHMPGIVEEAILAIRAGQPLYVSGGCGGAAGDVARVLGFDPDNWLGSPDYAARSDLRDLANAVEESGWVAASNGLAVEQNRQLATSYRASQVASLVIHGLINVRTRPSTT